MVCTCSCSGNVESLFSGPSRLKSYTTFVTVGGVCLSNSIVFFRACALLNSGHRSNVKRPIVNRQSRVSDLSGTGSDAVAAEARAESVKMATTSIVVVVDGEGLVYFRHGKPCCTDSRPRHSASSQKTLRGGAKPRATCLSVPVLGLFPLFFRTLAPFCPSQLAVLSGEWPFSVPFLPLSGGC